MAVQRVLVGLVGAAVAFDFHRVDNVRGPARSRISSSTVRARRRGGLIAGIARDGGQLRGTEEAEEAGLLFWGI